MKLYIFSFLFFTSFFYSVPIKIMLKGDVFESQKINASEFIRVWRYTIPRLDLEVFARGSRFGFNSEDDLIAFLQFLLFQLKCQKLHERYIESMNISLLLSFERSFPEFESLTGLTFVPDSDVVAVYEYVVKKDEPNALQRVDSLKSKAFSDLNFVQSFFRDIGEVSVLIFNPKSIKSGDVFILEDKFSYRICYIASLPYKKKAISNTKTVMKDLFLTFIETALDSDCLDIEN